MTRRNSAFWLTIILCISMLGGCSGFRGPPNLATPEHARGTVERTDELFFAEYRASYENPDSDALAARYALRGANLAMANCERYLAAIESDATKLEVFRAATALLAITASGAFAIFHAGPKSFLELALAATTTEAAAGLVRDKLLLGPDPHAVMDLVLRSMAVVHDEIDSTPPRTFDEAFQNLRSIVRLCEPASVRHLVQQALSAAIPKATAPQAVPEAIVLTSLYSLFNVPSLSDDQLIALYWIAFKGISGNAEFDLVKRKLGPLSAQLFKVPTDAASVNLPLVEAVRRLLVATLSPERQASLSAAVETNRRSLAGGPAPPPGGGGALVRPARRSGIIGVEILRAR